MKVMARLYFFIVVFLSIAAAGCATDQIGATVTRFQKIERKGATGYGTYSIFLDEKQRSSLEAASYLNLVRERLNTVGFKEELDPSKSDYSVFFNYSVRNGSVVSATQISPVAQGNSAFAKGFNMAGQTAVTTDYQRYVHSIRLSIAKFAVGKSPESVYEVSLASEVPTAQINVFMPVFVDALFKDFPGRNGETINVVLPVTK